jgi:hypothetical protein
MTHDWCVTLAAFSGVAVGAIFGWCLGRGVSR